ncbi:MAG: zinc ribbon domain-containing protein [Nitrospirota bacterium]|mgnify:FL=1
MPIYEYICMKCGEGFVLLQKVGATEKDTACPSCDSKDVKKKLSTFSCSLDTGFSHSSHSSSAHGGG